MTKDHARARLLKRVRGVDTTAGLTVDRGVSVGESPPDVIGDHSADSRSTHPQPRESSSTESTNKSKRRRTNMEKRRQLTEDLDELAGRVLAEKTISPEELELIRIGLAFYHSCGVHPDTFVCNDERLAPAEESQQDHAGVTRLQRALDRPPGQPEATRCQQSRQENYGGNGGVWACASCCEMLNDVKVAIVQLSIAALPTEFQVSSVEFENRYSQFSPDILETYIQVLQVGNQWYYLNPDLIAVPGQVTLCGACAKNPRQVRYSIASGHDYGRRGELPELTDTALNCIAPVRRFGIEIQLSAKRATGHSICFLTDGPVECSRVLPCIDADCHPRVTFLGPRDQWRKKACKFRNLFSLPEEPIYEWLSVLSETHSYFRDEGIRVDKSRPHVEALKTMERDIFNSVIVEDSTVVERLADIAADDPRVDTDGDGDGEVIEQHSAVLQDATTASNTSPNAVVDALVDGLLSDVGDRVSDSTAQAHLNPLIVSREADPVSEWFDNGHLLSGAFPTLFMCGGNCLPNGSLPKRFTEHLLAYYDGRFESDVKFVATIFNQMQRHAAVKKAARAGATHSKALLKLGQLANTAEFRQKLLNARDNPTAPSAKRLNSQLLRILSIVGTAVPFSAFELAAAKPKISAMRLRYGLPQHWVTIAPPEQDNLLLLRVAQLRKLGGWNKEDCVFSSGRCTWQDLPESLQQSAHARLVISTKYPALAAQAFDETFSSVQRDIVGCEESSKTRVSRSYDQI